MRDMTLEDFVRESNRIEGIEREKGDLQFAREIVATQMFVNLDRPTVHDLENFVILCTGAQCHPAVLRRRVGQDVRVGNYHPPPGGPEIEPALKKLLEGMMVTTPFKTHLAYESLHPFTDGNGRSGRALWLWTMGGEAPLGFLHEFYYYTLQEAER